MQSNPQREKMSVTGWLHRNGIKRFCCVWCMKDKVKGRIQFKHYNKKKYKAK
jgi:poly(3-hydroxyalkanoate) synthetase